MRGVFFPPSPPGGQSQVLCCEWSFHVDSNMICAHSLLTFPPTASFGENSIRLNRGLAGVGIAVPEIGICTFHVIECRKLM